MEATRNEDYRRADHSRHAIEGLAGVERSRSAAPTHSRLQEPGTYGRARLQGNDRNENWPDQSRVQRRCSALRSRSPKWLYIIGPGLRWQHGRRKGECPRPAHPEWGWYKAYL